MIRRIRDRTPVWVSGAIALATVLAVAVPAPAAEGPIDPLTESAEAIDVDRVTAAVREELSEARYQLDESFWERVQELLARAWVNFLEWAERISQYVGGPLVLGVLVGGAVIVATFAVTVNLGRRRARIIDARIRREHEAARGLDPVELERRAAEAEAASDYPLAFRLLFRSGLIRLDRSGRIDLRPGTTSGLLAEQLGSESFSLLIARFDQVVYGGAAATADDPARVRRVMEDLLGRSKV